MQWIGMIVSFIMGNMQKKSLGIKESALEIFDEVVYKSRSVVTLTLVAFAAIIFMCGGLFMALIQATSQYDRTGQIFFSSTIGAGLILAAVSLLTFAIVFTKAWPGIRIHKTSKQHVQENERPAPAGLEQALAVLVMDFVKDRELNRLKKEQQAASSGPERRNARRQAEEGLKESPLSHH